MKRRLFVEQFLMFFDDDEEEQCVLNFLQTECSAKRRKTHEMIKKRDIEGAYNILVRKYLLTEEDKFVKYLRITPHLFGRILENIGELISTMPTNKVVKPISPQQKLCVALRYLATGESLTSLAFTFRISQPCLTQIMKEVFKSIKDTMLSEMALPCREQFLSIARDFYDKWNSPNTIGTIDGKHVRIKCPNNSGSLYYNYKDFFSIVLLAVADANSKFIAIDVGSFGREGDAGDSNISLFIIFDRKSFLNGYFLMIGIFAKSNLGKAIRQNLFDVPPPTELPDTNIITPYVFLGDEAFPLLPNLLKPYSREQSLNDRSKAIFNYRLSRARRVVENSFGILSQRFRILNTPINLNIETVSNLVTSACILHNMMIEEKSRINSINDMNETAAPNNLGSFIEIDPLDNSGFVNSQEIRDSFKNYYNTVGAVSWQNETIRL